MKNNVILVQDIPINITNDYICLADIANGKYDAFLDLRGSRIIDIAASKLIVEEAGAIVTNKYGEKLDNRLSIYEKAVVVSAGNEDLHKQIIKIINNICYIYLIGGLSNENKQKKDEVNRRFRSCSRVAYEYGFTAHSSRKCH